MNSRRFLFILLLVLVSTIPAGAAAGHDIFSGIKAPAFGEGISLFPEPYDAVLEGMAVPEEQVIYLFRERCRAQNAVNQKRDLNINTYLVSALDRAWRSKSIEVRLLLEKDPAKSVARFEAVFAGVPAPADRGAFSFLLNALPGELVALSKLAPKAREAAAGIHEPAFLASYISQIDKTAEFFRKLPPWKVKLNQAKGKAEEILDRLQEHFSLEDTIMAVNWLGENNLLPEKCNASVLAARLTDRLAGKIIAGLQAELLVGLAPDDVVAIEQTTNPAGVWVKTALYRGRIRKFVKQYQKVFTGNQLAWLEPTRVKILAFISQTRDSVKDPASRETLSKMQQNLDEMKSIMQIKTRLVKIIQEVVITVFRKIGETLRVIDPDQVLSRQ